MPSEKPLPESDDIIDLTDLVEEDAGGKPAGKESSADMSFEQELDDLFGDVEPDAPKPAATIPPADDDVVDLAGLELSEEPEPAPAAPETAKAAPEDDIMDLSGFGLEEPEAPPTEAEAAKAAPDEDIMDLAGLDFDEKEIPEAEPAVQAPEAAQAAPEAEPEPDLADLGIPGLDLPETEPSADADMAALLGDMPAAEGAPVAPEDDAMDLTDLAGLTPLEEQPAPPAAPVAAPTAAPAAAVAAPAQAIDLDALDQLILTAKGPAPEVEEAPAEDVMALWTARLDALEAATTALTSQIQELPPMPDGEALIARMESVLAERLDALRAELTAAVPDATAGEDLQALREELTAAIEAGRPDHEGLVADLRAALAPDFEALRAGLPDTDAFVTQKSLTEALAGLREGLSVDLGAVLQTAKQAAKDEAKAVGDALQARIAALEADHVDPDALAEQVRQTLLADIPDVNAAVAGVREGLSVDLGAVLQTAKQAAKDEAQGMGDALESRITALETDRIDPDELAERVRQALLPAGEEMDAAAKTAKQALDGLGARVTYEDMRTALAGFKAEIEEDVAKRIPQTAAAILRREIAALVKEFS